MNAYSDLDLDPIRLNNELVFLDLFLFELSCKNKHTHGHTHTHRDSNEYPIVVFSKNATIIIERHFTFIMCSQMKEDLLCVPSVSRPYLVHLRRFAILG